MAMAPVKDRVRKHRAGLRRAGLRPVQIWVPDTRSPHFADACRHECLLASQADRTDADLPALLDGALAAVDGWTA
jgi:hypothetical protein